MARELVPCPSHAAWERHRSGRDTCTCPQECHEAYLAYHRANAKLRKELARHTAAQAAAVPAWTARDLAVLAAHKRGDLVLG